MTTDIIEILKFDDCYVRINEMYENGELHLVFPELSELHTVEDGYKNNFTHTMGVLKNVCDAGYSHEMRIVALFHDIGKSRTKKKINEKWTFHNHESVGAVMSISILDRWRVDKKLTEYVYNMVKFHGRTKMHRDVSESAIRRLDKEVGSDIILDLIDFCKCDLTTKFQDKRERISSSLDVIKNRIIEIRKKDEEEKWRSPLTGDIIMKLLKVQPSKIIGEIKSHYDPLFKKNLITLDDAIKEITDKYVEKKS
jgi:poly(A) polymerase